MLKCWYINESSVTKTGSVRTMVNWTLKPALIKKCSCIVYKISVSQIKTDMFLMYLMSLQPCSIFTNDAYLFCLVMELSFFFDLWVWLSTLLWKMDRVIFEDVLLIFFISKTSKVPWIEFAKSPALLACITAHMCNNWTNYTLLTSLPDFMKSVMKFNIKSVSMFV